MNDRPTDKVSQLLHAYWCTESLQNNHVYLNHNSSKVNGLTGVRIDITIENHHYIKILFLPGIAWQSLLQLCWQTEFLHLYTLYRRVG